MACCSIKKIFAVGVTTLAIALTACDSNHKTAAVSVTSPSSSTATVGSAYTQTLTETGGTAPYTWSVASGSTLPAGLSLNSSTGVISGTPTKAGTYNVTFTVTDSSSPAKTATVSMTITIAGATVAPLTISTTTLTGGVTGSVYTQTLVASGGTAPYTWSVSNGTLPSGLTLGAGTGILGGTPSVAATSSFAITVTDAAGASATQVLSITIAAPPLAIQTTSLPAAVRNSPYNEALAATGGVAPYTWSEVGTIPAGLSFSPSTGQIAGTPMAGGRYQVQVSVTDSSANPQTANATLLFNVGPAATLTGTALLQGQYVMVLNQFEINAYDNLPPAVRRSAPGMQSHTSAQPQAEARPQTVHPMSPTPQTRTNHEFVLASLAFDGAGNVTGGYNFADDYAHQVTGSLSGTYTVAADGTGTLTLNYDAFGNQGFHIITGGAEYSANGVATKLKVTSSSSQDSPENGGTVQSSGFLELQDPSAFVNASLTGSSVFGFSGDTCTECGADFAQVGGLSAAGRIVVDSSLNLTGDSTMDIATNQAMDTAVSLDGPGASVEGDTSPAGAGTAFSTYGRSYFYPDVYSYPNGQLTEYWMVYTVDTNHAYFISQPYSSGDPLFLGEMVKQNGTFSNASLTGKSIVSGTSQGDGSLAVYDTAANSTLLYGSTDAILSLYAPDGAGNVATTTDANAAGTVLNAVSASYTYSVASTGRVTIAPTTGSLPTPIFWLSGTGQGFGTTQPTATGPWPMMLTMEPQSPGTFTSTSVQGAFELGYQQSASSTLVEAIGAVTLPLDLSFTGSLDPGTSLVSLTGSYTIDATGRIVASTLQDGVVPGSSIYYVVSPNRVVGIDTSTGLNDSALIVLQQ